MCSQSRTTQTTVPTHLGLKFQCQRQKTHKIKSTAHEVVLSVHEKTKPSIRREMGCVGVEILDPLAKEGPCDLCIKVSRNERAAARRMPREEQGRTEE